MGAYEFNPYRFDSALELTANGLVFTIRGEPGKTVTLERRGDLVNWEPVAMVPIPASGQTLIDPAATREPFLFYRGSGSEAWIKAKTLTGKKGRSADECAAAGSPTQFRLRGRAP